MAARRTLVTLLCPDLDVGTQVRWAVRLAAIRRLDLLILHRLEDPEERVASVAVAYDEIGVQLNVHAAGTSPVSEELATEVRTLASDQYAQAVRVRLVTRIEGP